MTSRQALDFEDIGRLIRPGRRYAVAVRQTSVLPAASFGFHLAVDTLAVRLTVPLAMPVLDFNPTPEIEKRKRANDRGGARRLRRFTSRLVLAVREPTVR